MKLKCPSCGREFPPEDINIKSDIAYCRKCSQGFAISELVGAEGDAGEGVPERAEMPGGTKVRFTRDRWNLAAILPRGAPRGFGCFMLFFTIFWNTITWTFVLGALFGDAPDGFQWAVLLFMVPFVLIGIVTLILALYGLFGRCSFAMNASEILIVYKVFLFRFRRRYRTPDLERVALAQGYKQNDSPVMGVGLFMKGRASPVVFGTGLSDEEKRWLAWEVHDFKRGLPPPGPDTPGGLVRGERPPNDMSGGHYMR